MRSRAESLEFALLGLLKESSLHGYELRKRLTAIFGPFRALSFSVLYPQLKRMLDAGLIIQLEVPKGGKSKRVRIVYSMILKADLDKSAVGLDKYLLEWRRHSLETAEREITWLDQMIRSERKN